MLKDYNIASATPEEVQLLIEIQLAQSRKILRSESLREYVLKYLKDNNL